MSQQPRRPISLSDAQAGSIVPCAVNPRFLSARRIRIALRLGAAMVSWGIAVALYQSHKRLPDDLSFEGEVQRVAEQDVEFLYDLTYRTASDEPRVEQQIFDRFFQIIEGATKFVVIDAFLVHPDSSTSEPYRRLSQQLTEQLLAKKKAHPEIQIVFLTDPINTFYGCYRSDELEKLRRAGIQGIVTDLNPLRDSNPYYGSLWRTYLQWFGAAGEGWINHPLGGEQRRVTLRSVFALLNTKANHRKLIVADDGESFVSLVTSANPHEASSRHSNVALVVRGALAGDLLRAEQAVARMSGVSFVMPQIHSKSDAGSTAVQLLTEGKIKAAILRDLAACRKSDAIDLAMFYFSDRDLIGAIESAANRGVAIRIILDPNKDAFGRQKNGIPNRPVAHELTAKFAVPVRWYETRGEQFHTKLLIVTKGNERIAYAGSANYTRRNLDDLNLEASLRVATPRESELAGKLAAYFDRIWSNDGGVYTGPYEEFRDDSAAHRLLYRFQESFGFSSF